MIADLFLCLFFLKFFECFVINVYYFYLDLLHGLLFMLVWVCVCGAEMIGSGLRVILN